MSAVVHTASLHVPHLAARSEQEFRDVNVHATRRLLQTCGEAGMGRFVYTSTTSLYGAALVPDAGEVVVSDGNKWARFTGEFLQLNLYVMQLQQPVFASEQTAQGHPFTLLTPAGARFRNCRFTVQ